MAVAKEDRGNLLGTLLLCGLRRLFLAKFQHEESLAEVQSLAMEPAEVLLNGAASAVNTTKGLKAEEFEGKLPGPPPLLPTDRPQKCHDQAEVLGDIVRAVLHPEVADGLVLGDLAAEEQGPVCQHKGLRPRGGRAIHFPAHVHGGAEVRICPVNAGNAHPASVLMYIYIYSLLLRVFQNNLL